MEINTQNPDSMADLRDQIIRLKTEREAIIVAHYYQRDEVQAIADVVGDSFALARHCTESNAPVIVFCGVHFMAESAKILSPEKTVLLPEINAGCPMADMVEAPDLRRTPGSLLSATSTRQLPSRRNAISAAPLPMLSPSSAPSKHGKSCLFRTAISASMSPGRCRKRTSISGRAGASHITG